MSRGLKVGHGFATTTCPNVGFTVYIDTTSESQQKQNRQREASSYLALWPSGESRGLISEQLSVQMLLRTNFFYHFQYFHFLFRKAIGLWFSCILTCILLLLLLIQCKISLLTLWVGVIAFARWHLRICFKYVIIAYFWI